MRVTSRPPARQGSVNLAVQPGHGVKPGHVILAALRASCLSTSIVPLYQNYSEINLQYCNLGFTILRVRYVLYRGKRGGGGEGTIIAYNALGKIIYNPRLYFCCDFFLALNLVVYLSTQDCRVG